jgi:flagellar basal-body rod modification protein FlgD
MELQPILPSPVRSATANATAADSASADFESFLTLLTAQLRNQDPLSPLDATEFVAQLASFSSVEQLVGVNERLDGFDDQILSGTIASFSSWIGRDVAVSDGQFLYNGAPVEFAYEPPTATQSVIGTVKTASGAEVSRFTVDGSGLAAWSPETALPAGTSLVMELEYFNDGVSQGGSPANVLRRVTGLEGTSDGFVLTLNDGDRATVDEVVMVRDPAPSHSQD